MQVLLLAGPGVVVGTALTAVFVKFVFPYNWTWLESLLFGAMPQRYGPCCCHCIAPGGEI